MKPDAQGYLARCREGYTPNPRKYGLTDQEAYELTSRGAVSAETATWAKDLRERAPEYFND